MKIPRSLWPFAIFSICLVAPAFTAPALDLVSPPDASLAAPAGGSGDSGLAVISADGRFVLFASTAENLVPLTNAGPVSGLQPRCLNVFLRDRIGGTTRLASVNPAGGGGNGDSLPAGISTNGQFALFESAASNLFGADTNGAGDVFLRDMVSGTTMLVSANAGGGSGNGESRSPTMTPDGRYVAFVSAASNLIANDTNGIPDVFVRDLQAGTTMLVSVGAKSHGAVLPFSASAAPEITPDGRYVAFYSTATNLVPGVMSFGDVYVRDRVAETTAWASTNAQSIYQSVFGVTNIISCNHRLSADGRYVAFEACTNQVNSFAAPGVVLRHDLQTGATDIVHTNAHVPLLAFEDIHNLDLTPDGRFLAFVANVSNNASGIYLWDAQAGTNRLVSCDPAGLVSSNATADWPKVDATGRYVVFTGTDTNLTTNAVAGVFLRDLQTATNRLVSFSTNRVPLTVSPTSVPALSSDGCFIAFEAQEANRNGESDVFVRDAVAGTTALISVRDATLPALSANNSSGFSSLSISSNGLLIAFASEAGNLVRNDTNNCRDIFVRDRLNATNRLVSIGTNGVAGAGFSTQPALSADGRYVAFASFATNLVARDTNRSQDVFVRDLQTGVTTLISASTNGGFGNADSQAPMISADGKYVLFRSKANNLAAGSYGTGTTENLFCRNRQTGTTYGLTTSGLAAVSATPDGRFVALAESVVSPGNVYLWDAALARRIYTNATTYAGIGMLSISPDANRIAVLGSSATYHLVVIDRAANTNTEIALVWPRSGMGLRFSANGRFLAYAASAATSTSLSRVYLYDFLTRSNRLISRSFTSTNAPDASCDYPDLTADGRYVVYRTLATNSVAHDSNGVPDLVLHDQLSGTTVLLSVNQAGTFSGNNRCFSPVFSGDGKTLVFTSWASDLAGGDFNGGSDVFAFSFAITDADGDGMDDQWEQDHFGTLARSGAGDYDSDGGTDLFEFQTGTDPGDPDSLFRGGIIPPAVPGQGPTVFWPVAPLKSYRVQYKNDLEEANWHDLNGGILLLGNTGSASDPSPASGKRFYRILLNQ